jgi:hypothetical protein
MEVPRTAHLKVSFDRHDLEMPAMETSSLGAAPAADFTAAPLGNLGNVGNMGGMETVVAAAGGLGMAAGTPTPTLVLPSTRSRAAAVGLGLPAGVPEHELVRQARIKGYEGDPCGECGQFTMVRNGTCLKCLSCGATSGCS